MLQSTVLLAGLVAIAHQVAAAQPALNCDGNAPSDGTMYTDSTGKQYDITCSAGYTSSTGWDKPGGYYSFDQCVDYCSSGELTQNCNFVSWTPQFGQCYMTRLTQADLAQGTHATPNYHGALVHGSKQAPLNCHDGSSNGAVFTASSQKYQILCNYQYGGANIGASKRADTFEQCVGYCDANADCVDVVYSDAKYCYLKSSKTNGFTSNGWYTAVKVAADFDPNAPPAPTPAPPNSINCVDGSADKTVFTAPSGAQYDIKCNFQYDGQALGSSKYTETFELCADLCDSTNGCVEGIWSSAKYCWLKSSVTGNGRQSSGWYSAVKKQ